MPFRLLILSFDIETVDSVVYFGFQLLFVNWPSTIYDLFHASGASIFRCEVLVIHARLSRGEVDLSKGRGVSSIAHLVARKRSWRDVYCRQL